MGDSSPFLLVALLIGPIPIELLFSLLAKGTFAVRDLVAYGVVALFGGILGMSISILVKSGGWRLAETWYEALFVLSGIYLIQAMSIFVTGHALSKFDFRSFPRLYGFTMLAYASILFVIAIVTYVTDRKRRA